MPETAAELTDKMVRFTNEQIVRFCEAAGVTRPQIVRAQNDLSRFDGFLPALAYAHLAESPEARRIADADRRASVLAGAAGELASEWGTDPTIAFIVRLGREQAIAGKPLPGEAPPFTSWMARIKSILRSEPSPLPTPH